MAKAISLAAAAYKLVWVRVALFLLIPVGAAFLAAAEGMTDKDWEAMGQFSRVKFFVLIGIPGATTLAAFIDNSLARAKDEHKKAKAEAHLQELNPRDAP